MTKQLNDCMQARVPGKPTPAKSTAVNSASAYTAAPKSSPTPAKSSAVNSASAYTAAPKSSSALSPQAQAYKQQLEGVKSQLMAMGVTGDQLAQHPQVRQMQAQLDQMIGSRSIGSQPAMHQMPTGQALPKTATPAVKTQSPGVYAPSGYTGSPLPASMTI
mmetsp:Transcript_102573/g.161926  ORF Transcript_102573/g.161926 Transcript_102573/m.161926 type:complete len:161 (+) Transcript_102573:3-485(+)